MPDLSEDSTADHCSDTAGSDWTIVADAMATNTVLAIAHLT